MIPLTEALLAAITASVPAPTLPVAVEATPVAEMSVYADAVYTGAGETIENAMVVIADGKITAITPGAEPGDEDLHVAAITPGMVDLSARIYPDGHSVEETEEVTPWIRVDLSLDPFSRDWDRQLRNGVTSVVASPYDNNCIGGLSVALKTGGSNSIEARTIKSNVALRGAIGSQPSSKNHPAFGRPTDFYSRRPTTVVLVPRSR